MAQPHSPAQSLPSLSMAMLPTMLADDRRRAGWSVARAAYELGVSVRTYLELEAGDRPPTFETWDRICKLFGWPRMFAGSVLRSDRPRTVW